MHLSKLIAKMLSVVYLSAGLGAMFNADYYRRLANDMFSNAAVTYLAGFTAVIIGSLIVSHHNTWKKDWTVLITIIGWAALIKGIFLIAFPQLVSHVSETMFTECGLRIYPYAAICLGILFGYFGFVSGEAPPGE